ncbi:MAG TPA: GGDEF domain-containing protein [Mycobacteriales bacterium]|jgi:diguanylate cyclase (GGDEF)-like protein|nr:GGDEF domain-containing protein [Mycobacteriales bacterium]
MRSLSKRAVIGLVCVCVFFTVAIIAVGIVGFSGIQSTTHVGRSIVADELATASATAQVGRQIDEAQVQGDEISLSANPVQVAQLERELYDVTLPGVDSALARLQQLHAGDSPSELAGIRQLNTQWAAVRALLTPLPTRSLTPSPARAARLDAAFTPLAAHVDGLIAREASDAQHGQHQASATSTSTRWAILGSVLACVVAAGAVAFAGIRRIKRAIEPENAQIEFSEALQMVDSEIEAHQLLKDHLERALPGTDATVLNRNNSADRLEAMTPLTVGSSLGEPLRHADPRSCLAVRSGRTHIRDSAKSALLNCVVCGDCPGSSSCSPFTVSGEVIGAVLVTQPGSSALMDNDRVRESVAQAAPVIANLRNLAIAELRAATDSLTGLPNKRAVTDTLKRMLAHASRSMEPLAMLVIDLDHFKSINDRLGHPIGDQALANVGAALKSALRVSDFAGRNGGEEFAVLLPDTGLEGGLAAAEKIRAAIADIDLPGVDVAVTASLGLAVFPEHATNAERLERLADAALYTAKHSGRNRVEIATPGHEAVPDSAVV